MAARNSSGEERRRARIDGNRPRTDPKPPDRKIVRSPTASDEPRTRPDEDGDVLEGLSRAISLVETIAVAMQTHEDDRELGPIAEALDVSCDELRRMYGAVDLALRQVKR
jgi:hypothetical protein